MPAFQNLVKGLQYKGTATPSPFAQAMQQNQRPMFSSMGKTAIAPEANIKKPVSNLPPAQVDKVQAPLQQPAPQGNTSANLPPADGNPNRKWQENVRPPDGTPAPQPLEQSQTTPQPTPQPNPVSDLAQNPSYGGVMGELIRRSQEVSPQLQQAKQDFENFQKQYSDSIAAIEGRIEPLEYQQGQKQIVQNRYANMFPYYSGALQAAQTGQGQQLGALGNILTNVPEALRYGVGGGGGALTPNVQGQNYAQEVINGSRSYQDAVQGMALYGNAGKQFLDNAIRANKPDFNFAQAQALAQTQGQIAPQLNNAQKALDTLGQVFNNTPNWQKTGVPVLNSLAGLVSNIGIGTGSQTAKLNAIREARVQVANALGTMTNSTPTFWDSTVQSWFPDNATPDQIQAGLSLFANFAQNRQGIFGAPGSVQPYEANTKDPLNIRI